MSTQQKKGVISIPDETDAYWNNQQSMYENFCQMVDEKGLQAGRMYLRTYQRDPNVDPHTRMKCEEYLKEAEFDEGDPNDEFREFQARDEETHAQRMDEHFYPSEGPRI